MRVKIVKRNIASYC